MYSGNYTGPGERSIESSGASDTRAEYGNAQIYNSQNRECLTRIHRVRWSKSGRVWGEGRVQEQDYSTNDEVKSDRRGAEFDSNAPRIALSRG